jgi:hypothetical protein
MAKPGIPASAEGLVTGVASPDLTGSPYVNSASVNPGSDPNARL